MTTQYATADHSLEWVFQLGDIDDTSYPEFIAEVGALAMGASTYRWMLRHVIKLGADTPVPCGPMRSRLGCSRTGPCPLCRARILDLSKAMCAPCMLRCAASGGKNLWLVGGGELVGQFHDAQLLDEIIVQVGSVTLGAGRPLLPRQIAFLPPQLASTRAIGPGFAEPRYTAPR